MWRLVEQRILTEASLLLFLLLELFNKEVLLERVQLKFFIDPALLRLVFEKRCPTLGLSILPGWRHHSRFLVVSLILVGLAFFVSRGIIVVHIRGCSLAKVLVGVVVGLCLVFKPLGLHVRLEGRRCVVNILQLILT